MDKVRDHTPVTLGFNGLYRRGDEDNCPLDHFTDCNNIRFEPGAVLSRAGLDILETDTGTMYAFLNIVRIYTFNRSNGRGLILLDDAGNFYHSASPTPLVPILTIAGCEDFTFVGVANRGYISPIVGDMGMEDEFVYVYLGDGDPARQAAGNGPTGSVMVGANGDTIDVKLAAGIHIYGVYYITDTGFRTKIGPDELLVFTATGAHKLDLSNIPVSPDSFVIARVIVGSKTINPVTFSQNPDPYAYELFLIPDGQIDDNVTTTLDDIDYYDSELLESAAGLLELLGEIPAVANLNTYHERVVAANSFGEYNTDPDLNTAFLPNTIYVSNKGEPEAFNEVSGVIQAPQDGYKLTCTQEYRDVLYAFKNVRTYAYNDNGDVPSSWPLVVIDQGTGASLHGVATVLDSGGINIDFLIVINFNGLVLFTGTYIKPELTWKIESDWMQLDREQFNEMQMVNDSLSKQIFVVLPNNKVLLGDYTEAFDLLKIKWAYWTFTEPLVITTLALRNVNELVLGFRREV